jgi:hypothetical protein
MPKSLTEIRKEPGKSNAYKYKGVAKKDFAGPSETYPINTLKRAKSAIKLAHNSPQEESIKARARAKYPQLKKGKK